MNQNTGVPTITIAIVSVAAESLKTGNVVQLDQLPAAIQHDRCRTAITAGGTCIPPEGHARITFSTIDRDTGHPGVIQGDGGVSAVTVT